MPFVATASSDTKVTQEEVITADLDAKGDLASARVNQAIRAEGAGRAQVKVPALLAKVKATPEASVEGTNLLLSADMRPGVPSNLYFGGQAKVLSAQNMVMTPTGPRQLPIAAKTEYNLNGAAVSDLNQVAGAGGEFEIKVTLTNTTGAAKAVTYTDSTSGKEVTDVGFVFTPFTVKLGPWTFNDNDYKDLQVENAVIERSGANTVITSSNVLFPPTTPGNYTVSIKGKTRNFQPNSARIVATPGVGTELPKMVQDAQDLGGGRTKLLYDALQQFLGGFEQLTSPTAGLPFAADGANKVIYQGLFVLKDKLAQGGKDVNAKLLPGVQKLYDGLGTLRDTIRDTLSPAMGTLRDTLGSSYYFNPLCRDLPSNRNGGCTFNQYQLPEVPPLPALRDTYALAANADTRGRTTDQLKDKSVVGGLPYNYQRVQRSVAGQIPDEIRGSKQNSDGSYNGSLYNWAAFTKFAGKGAIDADGDAVPDFEPFTFPDPNKYPQYYTSGALGFVALKKGQYYPGLEASGGPAANTFATALCEKVSGINGEPIDKVCPAIPAEDITLRDLLSNNARNKILPLIIKIKVNLLNLGPNAKTLQERLATGLLNLGERPGALLEAAKSSPTWLALNDTQRRSAEQQLTRSATDRAAADPSLAWTLSIELPLPAGDALAGSSNKGISHALQRPDTIPLSGQISSTVNGVGFDGKPFDIPLASVPINAPFHRATCVTSGPGYYNYDANGNVTSINPKAQSALGLNLGEALGLDCSLAHSGPLGMVEASGTVMEQLLHSPGWNFDNYYRGDPGYQTSDVSLTTTGPKLYEVLNIIAFSLDRKDALCPAKTVTTPNGGGTPRVVPPRLTTPCSDSVPDTANATGVNALTNLVLPGVGDPKAPSRDAKGTPTNLATALIDIAKALGETAPQAIGDDDPSQVGKTLAGSLAAIRDGLSGASTKLAPAVTGTPLLIGAVGNAQLSGDLATALSKAGLAQAKKYQFMGSAKVASGKVSSTVIFVLQTVGLKP